MALTQCPECHKPLTPEESLRGTCPGCGKPLASPITAGPPPPPPVENVQARPLAEPLLEKISAPARSLRLDVARVEQYLAWASVRTGLTVFITGMVVFLCGLLFLQMMEGTRRGGEGLETRAPALVLPFYLALVVGGVQVLTGMCMVAVVPASNSAAKGFAKGVILCLAVALLALLSGFGGRGELGATSRVWVTFLFGGLVLARLLFAGFLGEVAKHFGEPGVVSSCWAFIPVSFLFEASHWLMVFRGSALGEPTIVTSVGSGAGWTLAGIALGVWLLGNAVAVRGIIHRMLLEGKSQERETPPERAPEVNSGGTSPGPDRG